MATTEYHPGLTTSPNVAPSSEALDRLKRRLEDYRRHGSAKTTQFDNWSKNHYIQERDHTSTLHTKWVDQRNAAAQRKPVPRKEPNNDQRAAYFNKLKRKLDNQSSTPGQPQVKSSNVPSSNASSSVSVSVVQQINPGEKNTIETRLTIHTGDNAPPAGSPAPAPPVPPSESPKNYDICEGLEDLQELHELMKSLPPDLLNDFNPDPDSTGPPPPAYPHEQSFEPNPTPVYSSANQTMLTTSTDNGQMLPNPPPGPAAETLKQLAAQHHCNEPPMPPTHHDHPAYSQHSSPPAPPPPHYYQQQQQAQQPYAAAPQQTYSTAVAATAPHLSQEQDMQHMQSHTHLSTSQQVHLQGRNIHMQQQMAIRHHTNQMYTSPQQQQQQQQQQQPPQHVYEQQHQQQQQAYFMQQHQAMRHAYYQKMRAPPYPTPQMRFARPPNAMTRDWQRTYMSQSMSMRAQMPHEARFDSFPTEAAFIDDLLSSKVPT